MKYYLFVLMLLIALHTYAQGELTTAKWMQKPVTVDGNNTEWGSLNLYDDGTGLTFAIANDSNNIYLCFETMNETAQFKLLHAGMKITLITKSKPKHEASILYPLPNSKQEEPSPDSNKSNNYNEHNVHNTETFRQSFISNHAVMNVSGFATLNGDVSTNSPALHAAINWDSASNLIYEVSISKKEFFGADYNSKETSGDILLNVEINGLHNIGKNNQNQYSENHEGGMHGGGMHGGGMRNKGFNTDKYNGGQQPSSNNANTVSLNTKASFKQRFVLSDGNH